MKFSTADLRTDRQWRSATGLDQKRLTTCWLGCPQLINNFTDRGIEQRQQHCPDEPLLDSYEDSQLFTLFSFSKLSIE